MNEFVIQLANAQETIVDILEIVGYFVAAILGVFGGKAHERRKRP